MAEFEDQLKQVQSDSVQKSLGDKPDMAAPPAPCGCLLQRLTASCGTATRGLDMRIRMGSAGASGVGWGGGLAKGGWEKLGRGKCGAKGRMSGVSNGHLRRMEMCHVY